MAECFHHAKVAALDELSTSDLAASHIDTVSGVPNSAPEGERGNSLTPWDRQSIHSQPPALPTNWGSQQWRLMRRAIHDGASIEEAANVAGMSLVEARALAKIDADRAPLPPEAFQLLNTTTAPAAQPEEPTMADNDDDDQTSSEVKQMDFAKAKRLYEADISPEKTQAASHQQAVGEAYKVIKKDCHIQPQSAKVAFKWLEMEEMHGDDFLRGLAGLVNEMAGRNVLTFHGGDLVDMAEGLAADLEGASQNFEEASEEELSQQEGRGEPAPGTGAAARKKMKESASVETAPAFH